VISPIQPGVEGTDWAEVWIVTEPAAILIMEPPYQGNFICFPFKKAHFFAPPLPFNHLVAQFVGTMTVNSTHGARSQYTCCGLSRLATWYIPILY
jgi:hypothetical protein